MSFAVIANPLAGRGRGKKVGEEVRAQLASKNADFEFIFTTRSREAIELAHKAAEKHEIVCALGGDGTIGEVLEGVYNTKSSLGIIPAGTGNDYARGLGIPRDYNKALETILNPRFTKMDVGLESDKVFGVLASVGFPVSVIDYVNRHRDGLLRGSPAILVATFQTIRLLPIHHVKITIDGKSFETSTIGVFLMNMPYGGGGLKFAPEARYDDGKFTILVINEISKPRLLWTLPRCILANM